MEFDINKIRAEFPILNRTVYGKPLAYFDNAATTHKPQSVIKAVSDFYGLYNSNIHRGVHYLSEQATLQYEAARQSVADFIHAPHTRNIIFTKGTTEGINLVAWSFGEAFVKQGDEILISAMEHHSNIVPWQMLCERKGAILKVIAFDAQGQLDMEAYASLLSTKTKLVSITHVSNSLGTVNPIETIISMAHARNIPVLVDAAQSIQHFSMDVQALDVDFMVFSGHKIYAETGIGVLYGKENLLDAMPPYQGGGDMIAEVSFEKTTYNELPLKFEAGTSHISGAISLHHAIQFVSSIGLQNISKYEAELLSYAHTRLSEVPQIRFIGSAKNKAGLHSFLIGSAHPYDTGMLLDKQGIAVRTGHLCTQPVMEKFEIPGVVRASFAFYNTFAEIDALIIGLNRAAKMLLS